MTAASASATATASTASLVNLVITIIVNTIAALCCGGVRVCCSIIAVHWTRGTERTRAESISILVETYITAVAHATRTGLAVVACAVTALAAACGHEGARSNSGCAAGERATIESEISTGPTIQCSTVAVLAEFQDVITACGRTCCAGSKIRSAGACTRRWANFRRASGVAEVRARETGLHTPIRCSGITELAAVELVIIARCIGNGEGSTALRVAGCGSATRATVCREDRIEVLARERVHLGAVALLHVSDTVGTLDHAIATEVLDGTD